MENSAKLPKTSPWCDEHISDRTNSEIPCSIGRLSSLRWRSQGIPVPHSLHLSSIPWHELGSAHPCLAALIRGASEPPWLRWKPKVYLLFSAQATGAAFRHRLSQAPSPNPRMRSTQDPRRMHSAMRLPCSNNFCLCHWATQQMQSHQNDKPQNPKPCMINALQHIIEDVATGTADLCRYFRSSTAFHAQTMARNLACHVACRVFS